MRIQVSAGFSNRLAPGLVGPCQHIAEGIRSGPAVNDEHGPIQAIVSDAALHFPSSSFVVGGWDWRRPDGSLEQRRDANLEPMKDHLANQCRSIVSEWRLGGREDSALYIEIGNELDGSYWKEDLRGFHATAMECYGAVRELSSEIGFITGSTMNFNKGTLWRRRGYEVLNELCAFPWPSDTLQGLHPYRTDLPQAEWPSFPNSAEALRALTRVLRGRKVAITEMGWHSGGRWEDSQIASFIQDEIRMWRDFGSVLYCHYQVADSAAPNNHGEGGFGAYRDEAQGNEEKLWATTLNEEKM